MNCDQVHRVTVSDPVWNLFEETSDSEIQQCKLCEKRLKTRKGSKTSLATHIEWHAKQEKKVTGEKLKCWLVSSMVTVTYIRCKVFSSTIMTFLFWLASLGPISETIARQCVDAEAEWVQ